MEGGREKISLNTLVCQAPDHRTMATPSVYSQSPM
jgi:hypothetical protein